MSIDIGDKAPAVALPVSGGRKYMGIERATFLVDAKGVVRNIWRKVKMPGHVDEVLAAVKAL